MEQKANHKIQNLIIGALALVMLVMSIGFAAYSSTLRIKGTTQVAPNKWSVHFVEEGAEQYAQNGASNYAFSVGRDRSVANFKVNLPGVFASYALALPYINDGTFPAKLTKIKTTQLSAIQNENILLKISTCPAKTPIAALVRDGAAPRICQLLSTNHPEISGEAVELGQLLSANQNAPEERLLIQLEVIDPSRPEYRLGNETKLSINTELVFEQI